MMKQRLPLPALLLACSVFAGDLPAQRKGDKQLPTTHPVPVGREGVQWYTTWETAKAEAARSGRPIFFMAASHACRGVPGVF